jgi:hypothetical protein
MMMVMTTTAQLATEADVSELAQLRSAWTAETDPGADDAAFAGRFSSWMDEEHGRRTFGSPATAVARSAPSTSS